MWARPTQTGFASEDGGLHLRFTLNCVPEPSNQRFAGRAATFGRELLVGSGFEDHPLSNMGSATSAPLHGADTSPTLLCPLLS